MISKKGIALVNFITRSLLAVSVPLSLAAQSVPDTVFNDQIRTVLFYQSGRINTLPIIDINDPQSVLTLSFDDLRADYRDLEYKVIHCNANWEPGTLMESDYLDGNTYNTIDNYSFSFNTYVDFVNYWCTVPGPDTYLKLPGNYVVVVYQEGNENNPLMTKRFYVVDNKAVINATIDRPSYAKYSDTHQEVDVEVDIASLDVRNPMSDIKLVIRQNQRWDNQKELTPRYVNGTLLDYNYEEENLFKGLSEWRYVDMRSVRYPRFGVAKIILDTIYQMYLMNDEDRSIITYSQWTDINGNRVIAGDQKDLKPHELDYVSAHFRLKSPFPYESEEVYLFGSFTDWKLNDAYKMYYDKNKNLYRANLFLKQGYYNFYYATRQTDGKINCSRFQGSHYETENNYYIFIYLYSYDYQADMLVGYLVVNSAGK